MRNVYKMATLLVVAAVACVLVACGSHTMSLETLEEVSGVKVTAENAGEDDAVLSEGAITVADGDALIISPNLDKGSFNLTVTADDGKVVAYDNVVEGKVLFQTDAEPGTYDVRVSGNGATGWMTVFAQPANELAEQNESLAKVMEDAGIDSSLATEGE